MKYSADKHVGYWEKTFDDRIKKVRSLRTADYVLAQNNLTSFIELYKEFNSGISLAFAFVRHLASLVLNIIQAALYTLGAIITRIGCFNFTYQRDGNDKTTHTMLRDLAIGYIKLSCINLVNLVVGIIAPITRTIATIGFHFCKEWTEDSNSQIISEDEKTRLSYFFDDGIVTTVEMTQTGLDSNSADQTWSPLAFNY